MRKLLVLPIAGVLVSMMIAFTGCKKSQSQYNEALDKIDNLQSAMDSCRTAETWDSLYVLVTAISTDPLFNNNDGKYSPQESDVIVTKVTHLIATSFKKQKEVISTRKLSLPTSDSDSDNKN